jgi:hypothetical protein
MLDQQAVRLGICGSVNEDVIDWLVRHLSVPARAYDAGDLSTADFLDHDVLLTTDTAIDEAKADEFVRALEAGLAAMVLIDADGHLAGRERYLVQRLGYELQTSRPLDRVRLEYTADYPVAAKRGHTNDLTFQSKRTWIGFKPLLGNFPPVRRTLVNRTSLLGKDPFAVLVELGDGMAVLCDSVSKAEDRADMLSHLVTNAKRRGSYRSAGWVEQARAALPAAAASLFEVYDEIPLGLLAERAGLDTGKIDGATYMGILEVLIRERRIAARIRGHSLVKQ